MAKLTDDEKARRALNRRRNQALQAEEDAIRREMKQREWDENGTALSWEEYEAGANCRGCGLPTSDKTGGWPLPIDMDEEQREAYEAERAEFRRRHADCRSHTWGVQGSKITHCGLCCPMPPMSPDRIAKIADFLALLKPTDPSDLDTWRLTLTCDHVVEKTQHRSHDYWSGTVTPCPTCDRTRGIVTTQRLPQGEVARKAAKRRMSAELDKARSAHELLLKKADSACQRVRKLEHQLAEIDETP